ncbi:hypothetical protein SARC_16017, partial [Sphaeroforma arctica JP610]
MFSQCILQRVAASLVLATAVQAINDVDQCGNNNGKFTIKIKDGDLRPDSSSNTMEFRTMVNNVEWMKTKPRYGSDGFVWNIEGHVHRFDCAVMYFELFEDGWI